MSLACFSWRRAAPQWEWVRLLEARPLDIPPVPETGGRRPAVLPPLCLLFLVHRCQAITHYSTV